MSKKVSFTKCERLVLVELVTKYPIIEVKKTDMANTELKKRAWEEVRDLYNGHRNVNVERTEKQLRKCWTNYKQKYLHLWKDKIAREFQDVQLLPQDPEESSVEILNVSQLAEPCMKEEESVFQHSTFSRSSSESERTKSYNCKRITQNHYFQDSNQPRRNTVNLHQKQDVRERPYDTRNESSYRKKESQMRRENTDIFELKRRMHRLQICKFREEIKFMRIQHSIYMQVQEEQMKLLELKTRYCKAMQHGVL